MLGSALKIILLNALQRAGLGTCAIMTAWNIIGVESINTNLLKIKSVLKEIVVMDLFWWVNCLRIH